MTIKEKIKHKISILNESGKLNRLSDYNYIKLIYWMYLDEKLNLRNPKTFNEKIQWLKLYDRQSEYTTMVDKYEVKEYIKKIVKDKDLYVIKTLGVYNSFDEIDFNKLPKQFVIKCTHDSGGVVVVKDKDKLDKVAAREKIENSLKCNYYWKGREWPYKNVKPRVIVEEYMEDKKLHELRDYKFFVFSGKMELMFVASNRQGEGDTYFDFYDRDFNHLDIINGHPNNPKTPSKPKNYEKMILLAEKIAGNKPQVRIDFYEINGVLYFGEITFYHWGGFVRWEPEEWNQKLGELIKLPKKKCIKK